MKENEKQVKLAGVLQGSDYESVRISLVEAYEGVGKSTIFVCNKPKGPTDAFYIYGCEKVEKKIMFWFCKLFIFFKKRVHLQSSKLHGGTCM